jgi:hypothetical protein
VQIRRSTGRRAGVLATLLALALLTLPAVSSARVPTYRSGSQVTFSVRSDAALARQYGMYITVASKKRVDRNGRLKQTDVGTFARMTRKRAGVYKWTTPPYTFDTWFMVKTGTYYWQTQYTDCSIRGCNALSRIRSFKVA